MFQIKLQCEYQKYRNIYQLYGVRTPINRGDVSKKFHNINCGTLSYLLSNVVSLVEYLWNTFSPV